MCYPRSKTKINDERFHSGKTFSSEERKKAQIKVYKTEIQKTTAAMAAGAAATGTGTGVATSGTVTGGTGTGTTVTTKKTLEENNKTSGSLLLTRAAGTEIIVTPTSRVNSMTDLSQNVSTETVDLNLLCPDLDADN